MTTSKRSQSSKVILVLSILTFLYWYLSQLVNIYHYAVVGAIYEILWLPMLAIVFVLPILALVFLIRERFNRRSLHFYSLIVGLATIVFIFTSN